MDVIQHEGWVQRAHNISITIVYADGTKERYVVLGGKARPESEAVTFK